MSHVRKQKQKLPPYLSFLYLVLFSDIVRVVSLCLFVVTSLGTQAETLAQRQALYEFYQSTTSRGTSQWQPSCASGGWLTMTSSGGPPATFCNGETWPYFTSFFGVKCTAQGGDIIELKLANCNLKGSLVTSLQVLTSLKSIHLQQNRLTGTLPPEWGPRFLDLTECFLSGNLLSGPLPAQWSAMSSLYSLQLDNNFLNETIPNDWSQWRSIQFLDLSSNNLTGTLPVAWSSWANGIIRAGRLTSRKAGRDERKPCDEAKDEKDDDGEERAKEEEAADNAETDSWERLLWLWCWDGVHLRAIDLCHCEEED